MLIGSDDVVGAGASFRAIDPSSDAPLDLVFAGGTALEVSSACAR
jgi:hypothetical protein